MLHRVPGLMFEAVAEATVDAGGGEQAAEPLEPAGDGGAGGEPAPVEAEPTPAGEPDYTGWLQTDDGQQAVQQAVQRELEAARQADQQQTQTQQQDELVPPDPWTSDNYAQDMNAYLAERDRRLIEAIQASPAIQHAEAQNANEWVETTFSGIERDLKLPDGTHLPDEIKALSVAAAAGSVPPGWQPGMGGFDPAQAVAQHAKSLHTLISSREAAAVKAYQDGVNPAEQTAGATEPPAHGLAAVRTEDIPSTPNEVTRRWMEKQDL